MAFSAMKCLLILLVFFAFEGHIFRQAEGATTTAKPVTKPVTSPKNITHTTPSTSNGTEPSVSGGSKAGGISFPNNKGLLKRMLYVAVACSALIALYFIVKTIRTKSRKNKSKKYGMIFSSGDVEMQPLDNDDDDDDMTVFDRKTRK